MKIAYGLVFLFPLGLLACASLAEKPTNSMVEEVKFACDLDVSIRPEVIQLEGVPGLISEKSIEIIDAARRVIDPICENPNEPLEADAVVALNAALGQVVAVLNNSKRNQAN